MKAKTARHHVSRSRHDVPASFGYRARQLFVIQGKTGVKARHAP
jgi:hypothetical protein